MGRDVEWRNQQVQEKIQQWRQHSIKAWEETEKQTWNNTLDGEELEELKAFTFPMEEFSVDEEFEKEVSLRMKKDGGCFPSIKPKLEQ